jgi:putative tricarboxylic transport membrane protein
MIGVLPDVFAPMNLLVLFAGVLGGIIVGALPGLTPTMGVAILVPFTFGMSPVAGLILLGGVYCGSVYAGAITAILFNIPGAPANIATLFDGHPMANQGKGRQAIYYATTASLIGGIVGMLALLIFSPPLAQVSLKFGPAEIFWVAIFGVTIIASLSVGSMVKGIISGAIGLLMSTVGMDSVTGSFRYTFDSDILLAGIHIVAGLIGLFALSQVLVYFEQTFTQPDSKITEVESKKGMLYKTVIDTVRRIRALSIGSIVGTIIGIVPGAGGQVSALTAYNETKRWAPKKERDSFGKGNPDGVIACEAANNAMAGGSLIPLFTLGIPGSPTAAVLLGGLMIHGLFPGHELYTLRADVTYTFMLAMILAQFVMFFIGVSITNYMARILKIPKYFLGPAILSLCIIGTYATRNSMGDVYIMAILGVLMYLGAKMGFSAAAVVLGLILGEIAENGFLLGVRLGSAQGDTLSYFLTRPICIIVILLVILSAGFAFFLEYKESRIKREKGHEKPSLSRGSKPVYWWPLSKIAMRQWNLVLGLAILVGSVLLYVVTKGFETEPRLFPQVLLISLMAMSALLLLQNILAPSLESTKEVFNKWPALNMALVIIFTFAYIVLVESLGFYASTFLFMTGMPIFLQARRTGAFCLKCAGISMAFTTVMLIVFYKLLVVSTPSGWLI